MVGGRDYTNTLYGKFNLATEAVRQPGSAFKMFVLIAALEEGILPQTQFNSHRLLVELPGRRVWSVKNDEGAYRGSIPLTTATTFSDNTVFAQLALRVGTERIRRVAHADGHRAADRRRPGDRAGRPAPLLHADRDGARATRRSPTRACA